MRRGLRGGAAALLAAGLVAGGGRARAESDTFMAGFMITSGVVLTGVGTAGLVDLYGSGPPKDDEERRRRMQAEPYMWVGVTAGLMCFGFAALMLSEGEEEVPEEGAALSGRPDQPGAEPDDRPARANRVRSPTNARAPTVALSPLMGSTWGAAAAVRW